MEDTRETKKEASNAYKREWRKRNPEKVRAEYVRRVAKFGRDALNEKSKEARKRNYNKIYAREKRWEATVPAWASRLHKRARLNATKLGVPFDLTVEWVKDKLSLGACEATGLKLDFAREFKAKSKSPFAPSLDRRNNYGGYTMNNVQIVTTQYNIAKNEWPEDALRILALAIVSRRLS